MESGNKSNKPGEKEIQAEIIRILTELGWKYESQIKENYRIAPGQIESDGTRFSKGRVQIVDILLSIRKDFPIAVIEVKREDLDRGLIQASSYSKSLDVAFAFASNGDIYTEYRQESEDRKATNKIRSFPSPSELWERYKKKSKDIVSGTWQKAILQEYYRSEKFRQPRYYQRAAINQAIEYIRNGNSRGVISINTGHQYVLIQIIWKLWKSNTFKRFLLLFNSVSALEKMRQSLKEVFEDKVNLLELGEFLENDIISLSTFNKVSRSPILAAIPEKYFDLVSWVDIPRTQSTLDSYFRLFEKYQPDTIHLGFTSILERDQKPTINSWFGSYIYTYSLEEAVRDGFRVPFQIIRFVIPETRKGLSFSNMFVNDQAQLVAHNFSNFLKGTNRYDKSIIFCSTVEQASLITKFLKEENADLEEEHENYIVQITSNNDGQAKENIYQFARNESQSPVIAVSVNMLKEGIDVPDTRNIVLAKKVSSKAELLQIINVGSSISQKDTKNIFTIFDFFDSTNKFLGVGEIPAGVNVEELPLESIQDFGSATELQKRSRDPLISLESKLHSDHWSAKDYLGYEIYAQTIEHIIRDKESNPPLTIGIIAPWGQGKTTLMRYVWRRFNDDSPEESLWGIKANAEQIYGWVKDKVFSWSPWTNWRIAKWMNQILKKGKSKKIENDSSWNAQAELYPTVWFNPWKYQSSDQIWAGMADEIINQLVAKLPALKREKFWLLLQWKRIDKSQIRSDIHKSLLTRLIPDVLVFITAIFLGIVAFSNSGEDTGNILTRLFSALLAFGAAFRGVITWWKGRKEELAKRLEQYLQSPNYSARLGAFHHVNEDLERVFELLVTENTPAIIFIDDLDRCAPQKVVEVIEAINLMMNGKFREKCYFIMGMDAEMVSASIDVAYEKMQGLIPGKEDSFGSVGWYFLDKFIQLPFLIPTLRQEQKKGLIEHLFPSEDPIFKITTTQAEVSKAQDIAKKATSGEIDVEIQEEIKNLSPVQKAEFDKMFMEEKLEENKDSSKILSLIIQYEKFLNPSPRSIKRFANLLRFHTSYQELRQAKDLEYADSDTLAYWLILSLRWPQLVRWLQWHDEKGFYTHTFMEDKKNAPAGEEKEEEDGEKIGGNLISRKPMEKAATLDGVVKPIREGADTSKSYKMWDILSKENPHLKWLQDKELYSILVENHNSKSSFTKAFECGVW